MRTNAPSPFSRCKHYSFSDKSGASYVIEYIKTCKKKNKYMFKILGLIHYHEDSDVQYSCYETVGLFFREIRELTSQEELAFSIDLRYNDFYDREY